MAFTNPVTIGAVLDTNSGDSIGVTPKMVNLVSGIQTSVTNTTDTGVNWKVPFPATVSNLSRNGFSVPSSLAVTFRKNLANGSQTVTSSLTGWQTDAVNTDTLSSSDTWDVTMLSGATNNVVPNAAVVVDVSSALNNIMVGQLNGVFISSTFYSGHYFTGASSIANAAATTARASGLLSFLQVNVKSSTSATITAVLNKNGVSGNSTVTLTASTTGFFVDTTHTDAISSGDIIAFQFGQFSTSSPTYFVGAIITQSANSYDMGGGCGDNQNNTFQSTGVHVLPVRGHTIFNNASLSSLETLWSAPMLYAQPAASSATLSNSRIRFVRNASTSAATFQLRKNAANANQVVTIASAGTGLFEDTTHTDTWAASDLFAYFISGVSSQAATNIGAWNLTVNNGSTVAPSTFAMSAFTIYPDITWGPVNVIGY